MRNPRVLRLALAIVLLPMVAVADTVSLAPGAPERYVVQKGDTLWDIAGRFLSEPWRWPEVWQINPQIENPHWIYPGDEIALQYDSDKVTLRVVRRGGPRTVKLSPHVRAEPIDTAIPTIPIDVIHQFLSRPRIISREEVDRSAYIVAPGRESLMVRPGEKFFARGLSGDAVRFTVYRKSREYRDPVSDETIGFEILHVGDAVLDVRGDPATLLLTATKREVLAGDRLLPVVEEEIDTHFLPAPPSEPVTGQILSVIDGVTQVGELQVVVVNLGRADGIDTGTVLGVYQRGDTVVDRFANLGPENTVQGRRELELDSEKQGGFEGFAQAFDDYGVTLSNQLGEWFRQWNPHPRPGQVVQLPDERAGTIMIFRPFQRVSYGLVVQATRPMVVADSVRNP